MAFPTCSQPFINTYGHRESVPLPTNTPTSLHIIISEPHVAYIVIAIATNNDQATCRSKYC